jgi:hypothetical protein
LLYVIAAHGTCVPLFFILATNTVDPGLSMSEVIREIAPVEVVLDEVNT